jgi:UDP-N-acetylglucosamine--N-acetylmuramyl-(pentapeptide) pyrophosphoryl-undecaprenol N-acetylglucosamine transferase
VTILLIASSGGHLKELHALLPRLENDDAERLWITFDNPMSRSLLAGENVLMVPYVHPRDTWHTLVNARIAYREIRRVRPTAAFSTGSGVSLAWLPVAAAFGAKAHFIDSATRISGPSLCGRLLTPVPGIQVYSQYESWAKGRIAYGGSVFDGFTAVPGGAGQVRRVLVTVGSNERYGFERLINRLIKILPADAEVIWQIGCSNVDGLGIDGKPAIPLADMVAAHDWADIVVAHAGVGSAMIALEHGRVPVLIPRRKAHNEHIDDHQTQIARELGDRGLAVTADADELTLEHLEKAASMRVTTAAESKHFALV